MVMLVGSVAVASNTPVLASTWLVTGLGAFEATFTITVIGGKLELPASISLRVQEPLLTVQVQPAPVMDASVRPAGRVSITATGSVVGKFPPFETVTV